MFINKYERLGNALKANEKLFAKIFKQSLQAELVFLRQGHTVKYLFQTTS